MRRFLVFLACLPLMATNDVHFINIHSARESDHLLIRTEPEPLLAYKLIKDKNFSIDKNSYDYTLDALFRQTAFLMRTLERNRGTIHAKKSEPLPIISYTFELGLREVTGKAIEEVEYRVVIGLDSEPGMGLITCTPGDISHKFTINDLTRPETYRTFVSNIIFPYGERRMTLPQEKEYLIDLYYRWPEVVVSKSDFSVFDLFPSGILWNKGPIRKIKIHLGTTYVYEKEGQWVEVRSDHLRSYKVAIAAYNRVLKTIEEGDDEAIIAALEDYVQLMPGDKKALKRLMDRYLEMEMNTEAFNLISRFQPFFATIREGIPNKNALARKAENKRNMLLGAKASFEVNPDVTLAITSPAEDDLVTGTTNLEFVLSGNESPILEIDCYLDEQLITRLDQPPFRVPFTVDGAFGRLTLRVVAYFEDKTYREEEITINTIKVDEQQEVNLVALRASVFQAASKFDRELTVDDFVLKENKVVKKIEHFKKDSAPLRVAILLDSSISMFGPKLYRAQYAVKSFLSKLEPEDRASIYSFDNKVLKLSDFTNDFSGITPQLMTLSPQWATSLYDGMLIAHDALLGQNGTKVMIVISDGDDSMSSTTDIHVASVLRNSPVLVYSIILPGGFLGEPIEGERFLKEMARMSGSISTRISNLNKVDETFERIYHDLKSFYYLDYYSDFRNPDKRETKIRVKGSSSKVRYRAIN